MQRAKRLVVIGVGTHYGIQVLQGVDRYCREHGRWEYHLEANTTMETMTRAWSAIQRWKPDGIIACMLNQGVARLARESGLPAVNVTGHSDWTGPSVVTDTVAVGRMVAKHFLSNGLKSFAFCARTGESSAQRMSDGFEQELREAGFRCDIITDRMTGGLETDWVKNHNQTMLRLAKLKKPAGVFCVYDYRAHEVAWTCHHLGLRVPDDVAIVGKDNSETLCRLSSPPLSSVELDCQRIGFEAARMLSGMVSGRKGAGRVVLVPPRRLVVRQSSDIIATEDPDVAEAMRFIRQHASEPINVKDLLRAIPMSRRMMELRFVQLIGRTPRAEMMRLRMERATTLLLDTDLPIASVAQKSGFTGQEIFSTAFRRETGTTPSRYRQKSRL
jgi:LacI family transcriptional regulator